MRAYLVHPELTAGSHVGAAFFFNMLKKELENHVETSVIVNEMVLKSARPTVGDVVVFFNSGSQACSSAIVSFLDGARTGRSELIAVAISKDHRTPVPIASQLQNFDVPELLRQRKLTDVQLETVAVELARLVISRLQPTLSTNDMLLFLSYRRFDGEEIAGAIHDELQIRMKQGFRDLNGILVGEDAQEVIMENLRQCNVVVFLDTPKSGESEWIEKELSTALAMNIPIIWVRIGSETGRTELKVKPAGQPHLVLEFLEVGRRDIEPRLVDKILKLAFDISRQFASHVFSDIERIMDMQRKGDISLNELDSQFLTYEVRIPRPGRYRYNQRPMTHVIQFYGRIPRVADQQLFMTKIAEFGYVPHPVHKYHYYDTAVMLAPMPPQNPTAIELTSGGLVDSSEAYITSLENYVRSVAGAHRTKQNAVIISGAFPDCEPEHQQHITDAVHAFAEAVMDRGGTVIFGAHPTFQHLIFDMARQKRDDFKDAVHMYISKHFATDTMVDEYRQNATVTAIDDVDKDRAKSLTAMRRAMITDEQAVGMVVIGGKTPRPQIDRPGVDEEIEIAKSRGLPVFLIGSAGGRTAQLAEEHANKDWRDKPNGSPESFNHQLMVSVNYRLLAKDILDQLGI